MAGPQIVYQPEEPEVVYQPGMGWGDVASSAFGNIPDSAARFGEDLIQPILHPIDTAKSLGNIGLGAVQKLIPGEQSSEMYANAVGEYFSDRYGGMENLKRTIADDPVGFAADFGSILTLGAGTTARAAMTGGKVAKVAENLAHPVQAVGKGVAEAVGTLGTHTGGQSLRTAAGAGRAGGERAEAFRGALTGATPMDDVVADAQRAVQTLRARRGASYRKGMADLAKDTAVLNFDQIDVAMGRAANIKKYKGVSIAKSTDEISGKIQELVGEWKALDPTEYHTAEGMDALKQAIGDVRDSTQYGTPSRVVADQAYNAVKNEIVKQAPDYAKTMQGYWRASEVIKEMEKTLSLNPKASIDTSLRKLQSVMRNNANTNYGRRLALAEMLEDAGATTLMEKLAGQSLSTVAPRGLGRVVAGSTAAAGAALDPSLLATLPLQSPRIMGETAYRLGQASRAAPPRGTTSALFQTGRVSQQPDRSRKKKNPMR